MRSRASSLGFTGGYLKRMDDRKASSMYTDRPTMRLRAMQVLRSDRNRSNRFDLRVFFNFLLLGWVLFCFSAVWLGV